MVILQIRIWTWDLLTNMKQEYVHLHIWYGDSHFKLGVHFNNKSHKHLIRVLPQDIIPLETGEKETRMKPVRIGNVWAKTQNRHLPNTSPQWRNECDVFPLKMTGSEVAKNIQKTDINICVYYQNGHNTSKYYALIFLLQPVSVICIGNHWVGSQ